MTATAADYDGESSVKTCFSLSPPSALTQTNAATQLGGRNGFLVVHLIDRLLRSVEMGRLSEEIGPVTHCPAREEWPPNYPSPEDGFLRSV